MLANEQLRISVEPIRNTDGIEIIESMELFKYRRDGENHFVILDGCKNPTPIQAEVLLDELLERSFIAL